MNALRFLLLPALFLFIPALATAQPNARSLPAPTTLQELEELAALATPALFPLRTRIDLGEHYRPRYLDGDGVAIAVEFADGNVSLVSAHAHLANAVEVEIYVDHEWHSAEVHHGSGMFDLAGLSVDGFTPEDTIPLSVDHELTPTLYTMTPVTADSEPSLTIAALGDPPEEPWQFYVRSTLLLVNGYPILNARGDLIAISSVHAPDRRRNAGSLAVPSTMIAAWFQEWPQLETDSQIGWNPRERVERFEPTIDDEAFRK